MCHTCGREGPLSCQEGHTHAQEGHLNGTSPGEAILKRKSFGEGVSTDMTEEMVAATTFNASH